MLSDAEWSKLQRYMRLTQRKMQVLCCVFEEQDNTVIGQALGMSPRTVRTHLERLYRKCGRTSRVGAVATAYQTCIERTNG